MIEKYDLLLISSLGCNNKKVAADHLQENVMTEIGRI